MDQSLGPNNAANAKTAYVLEAAFGTSLEFALRILAAEPTADATACPTGRVSLAQASAWLPTRV